MSGETRSKGKVCHLGKRDDDDNCCGRRGRYLASISGRTFDYIILPDGNLLSGVSVAALFKTISHKIHLLHC